MERELSSLEQEKVFVLTQQAYCKTGNFHDRLIPRNRGVGSFANFWIVEVKSFQKFKNGLVATEKGLYSRQENFANFAKIMKFSCMRKFPVLQYLLPIY